MCYYLLPLPLLLPEELLLEPELPDEDPELRDDPELLTEPELPEDLDDDPELLTEPELLDDPLDLFGVYELPEPDLVVLVLFGEYVDVNYIEPEDKSEEFIIQEFIREKILTETYQEIPHSVAVLIDEMKESEALKKIDEDFNGALPHWKEYFDKLYFNMAGREVSMASIKCALTNISPRKLLFGTDWPLNYDYHPEEVRRYVREIQKLDLPKDDIAAMLGGNAAKMFGL